MTKRFQCFGQSGHDKTLALLLPTVALLWQQSFEQVASQVSIVATNCDTSSAIFSLIGANVNFAQAREFCESNDLGTLARISNQAEYDEVLALSQSVNFNNDFWIGKLRTLCTFVTSTCRCVCLPSSHVSFVAAGAFDTGELPGPLGYVFVDGSEEGLDFIRSEQGEFPWAPGQPDVQILDAGDENCAE